MFHGRDSAMLNELSSLWQEELPGNQGVHKVVTKAEMFKLYE